MMKVMNESFEQHNVMPLAHDEAEQQATLFWYERTRQAYRAAQVREAIRSHQQLQQLAPGSLYDAVLSGHLCMLMGNNQQALQWYDLALAGTPPLPDAWVQKVVVLCRLRHLEESYDTCLEALALFPEAEMLRKQQALLLMMLGRCGEALHLCQQMVVGAPSALWWHCLMVLVWIEEGDVSRALSEYEQVVLPHACQGVLAHQIHGMLLEQTEQEEAAFAAYEHALACDPGEVSCWCAKGRLLWRWRHKPGNLEAALACYDRAIQLSTRIAEAYDGRGNILMKLRRYDEAVKAYQQAVTLQPERSYQRHSVVARQIQAIQRFAKAYACYQEGEYQRALALLKQVLVCLVLPQSWKEEALLCQGSIHTRRHRTEEALKTYNRLLRLNPKHGKAYLERALLKPEDQRLSDLLKATRYAPGERAAWEELADVLMRMKDYPQALAAYTQALQLPVQHRFPLLGA